MPSVYTLGLAVIKCGKPAADGGMGTSLSKIGKTYQDTCKLVQEKSESTEHYEEGQAAPAIRKNKKKIPILTFSIMDPDEKFLADYVGGTYDATTGWNFDGTEAVAPLSFQVEPEQGLVISIPKGDIEAVINADMSAKGLFLVDFTVTPLAPDKAGVKAIGAKKKA